MDEPNCIKKAFLPTLFFFEKFDPTSRTESKEVKKAEH